jgi:hypothetical protein
MARRSERQRLNRCMAPVKSDVDMTVSFVLAPPQPEGAAAGDFEEREIGASTTPDFADRPRVFAAAVACDSGHSLTGHGR